MEPSLTTQGEFPYQHSITINNVNKFTEGRGGGGAEPPQQFAWGGPEPPIFYTFMITHQHIHTLHTHTPHMHTHAIHTTHAHHTRALYLHHWGGGVGEGRGSGGGANSPVHFLCMVCYFFVIRYSPQTSICVKQANDSYALVPNGNSNRGLILFL